MRIAVGFLVFFSLMLLTGIVITVSDWQRETVYESSGEYLMTDQEWEQFKIDLYNDEFSDINDVAYLHSGNINLVSFKDMRVEKDFAWGELVSDTRKIPGVPFALVFAFVFLGGVGTTIAVICVQNKKAYDEE